MAESHWEVKARFALAIGEFSFEFALLESLVNRLIHKLLGLDWDSGEALTSAIISISARIDILTNLAHKLEIAEPFRVQILAAVDEAVDFNAYRNWLLHDPWQGFGMSAADPAWKLSKQRMRPKGSVRDHQQRAFTSAEIQDRTKACKDSWVRMAHLAEAIERAREEKAEKPG